MIYYFVGEIWLIVENQRDVVLARNVFRGDDGELVPGNIALKGNVSNAPARHRAAYGGAINHFRKGNVVNIQRLARDFFAAFLAGNRFADWMIV